MTPDPVRIAVIGVGHLGRHHARILSSMEGARLTAVVDTIPERAQEVASATSARALTDYRDLLDEVDAVVVAVPTESHREVAVPFLERGIPVLVEKPMSRSIEDADLMLDAAGRGRAMLAVGHTERHNPAVATAMRLVTAPRFIEVHRLSAFPDRSLDIDVVFDLMIHDLDIILALVRSDVASIEAVGVPVLTPKYDIANVRLRFSSGCIANITASRISRDRVRKIRFFQPSAYVSVDYAAQKLEVWRLVKGSGPMPAIEGGEIDVPNEEPLKRELEDFVQAVATRRPPLVTGEQGRRALALAQQITDRMAIESQPRKLE
jgi:predicted dehydrogenase